MWDKKKTTKKTKTLLYHQQSVSVSPMMHSHWSFATSCVRSSDVVTVHLLCSFRSAASLKCLHWKQNDDISKKPAHPHKHTYTHTRTHTHTVQILIRCACSMTQHSLCQCHCSRFYSQQACLCAIHWGDLWIFYQNWPNCLTIHGPVQRWMAGGRAGHAITVIKTTSKDASI